jgi:diguanylate cyclase (GGDEF)-like protein
MRAKAAAPMIAAPGVLSGCGDDAVRETSDAASRPDRSAAGAALRAPAVLAPIPYAPSDAGDNAHVIGADAAAYGTPSCTANSRSLRALKGDIAPGDLGDLLAEILQRLRSMVGTATSVSISAAANRSASISDAKLLLEGVGECESALARIHATVIDEMARRNALEREIADTQTALAQALSELAGTGAGERHALHLAHHDGLTALPNLAYFMERLEEELSNRAGRRQALAVLCLDLDGFKAFNDLHGQEIGNELLRIAGIRLSRAVRADDMVCRLGGDQFGFLLADVHGPAQLSGLAGKLAEAIAAPLQIGKRNLRVHATIGIAVSPGHGVRAEELMRNASTAMEQAKRCQAAFAFFDSLQSPQAASALPV